MKKLTSFHNLQIALLLLCALPFVSMAQTEKEFYLRPSYWRAYDQKGINVFETNKVADVIKNADVLYVTRIQKERFTDLAQYEEVKNFFEITPELMEQAKEKMVVMHPLPRIGEIHYKVDRDPRAAYFRQVQNGLYIRMAILAVVLGQA